MGRRTRHLLLFGLPAVLVAVALAAWLLWPRTAITRENAARIQDGMSLAEVESLLGGPARDETTGPVTLDEGGGNPADGIGYPLRELRMRQWIDLLVWGALRPRAPQWKSNHVTIRVEFDAHDRVADFGVYRMRRVDEGPLDRLRRWLGL
jgi:hypothetical protein